MDQNEKFRNAVQQLIDTRAELVEVNRRAENAECAVDRAEGSLARTIHAISGDTPILYRGDIYELVDGKLQISPSDFLIVLEETD